MKNKKTEGARNGRTTVILLCCLALALIVAAGGYFLLFGGVPHGRIMENVKAAGIDVGGMTKQEAAQVLHQAVDNTCGELPVKITVMGEEFALPAQIISGAPDVDKLVADAYALGRTGSVSQRKQQQKQAEEEGFRLGLLPYLAVDQTCLDEQIQKIAARFDTTLQEAKYEIRGEQPDISNGPEGVTPQVLVITTGTPGYDFRPETFKAQILEALDDNRFSLSYSCPVKEPGPIDLQAIAREHCIPASEAVMDRETFEITPHQYGYDFGQKNVENMLKIAGYNQVYTFPFRVIEPVNTKEDLEALLFRDELSSFTAYAGSQPYTRDVNLRLSCQAINGKVVMPGEVFDYNSALGKRTPERGWKEAAGYVGNKTVNEYGGGICQASSCLYLTAMLADLEIVYRVNHGFLSSYMPYGMDATVSWGGPEFRFRNTTEYPIRIEAYSNGGAVTVRLLGTDTRDYYVKMDYEILDVDNYEVKYEELKPDNEDGYKDGDVMITPYTGYKIATYRCKYNKKTDELISREHEATSYYSRRDKVICKIAEPEPPETTAPPETTVPPETTLPPETTAPPETTTPPETTQPPETTVPAEPPASEGNN